MAATSWKPFTQRNDVFMNHYYCDNRHFADKAFIDNIAKKGQTNSYCAVYEHFQNGKQKRSLRMYKI